MNKKILRKFRYKWHICQTREKTNMEPNLKVGHTANGLPLVQFLADRLSLSRRKAKEIIDQRRVFVNGKRTWMARHILKTGDIITGLLGLEQPAAERPIPVIYQDGDYLIVDKPSGIEANGKDSVEEALNKRVGSNTIAACHRLDKDTSGCLIFAKHPAAKERIIPLFAGNKIGKFYQAIIAGRLPEKSIAITKPIEGQRAVTHVRVIDTTPAASHSAGVASHVSIKIETGRTHQIRKHLASLGHPVLGDRQYGGSRAASPLERSIPRQMLHAAEISFINPMTGKSIRCRTEPPDDFRDCLKQYHMK
jgi:23S rRNA pseudouridine1911/1915/1917 synthase